MRGVDLHLLEFAPTAADEFLVADLRDDASCRETLGDDFDEIYQRAADFG